MSNQNEIVKTAGVVLLADDSEKVLLVRHEEGAGHITGSYGLPAGKIDKGEEEIEAAARELEEETGVSVPSDQLVFSGHYEAVVERKKGNKLISIVVFTAKAEEKSQLTACSETYPVWVPVAELDNYQLLPNIKTAILEAVQVLSK